MLLTYQQLVTKQDFEELKFEKLRRRKSILILKCQWVMLERYGADKGMSGWSSLRAEALVLQGKWLINNRENWQGRQ